MFHRFLTHLLVTLSSILLCGLGTVALAHNFWLPDILPSSDEFKSIPLWWSLIITFLLGFYARLQTPLKPFLGKFHSFVQTTRSKKSFSDRIANLALFWSRSASIVLGIGLYQILRAYYPLHETDSIDLYLPELTLLCLGYLAPSLTLIKIKSKKISKPVFLDNSDENPICFCPKGEDVEVTLKDLSGIKSIIKSKVFPLFVLEHSQPLPSIALVGERGAGKSLCAQYLQHLLKDDLEKNPQHSKIHFISINAWKIPNTKAFLDKLLEDLTFILSSYSDTTDISLPRSLRKIVEDSDQSFIKKFLESFSLSFDACLLQIDRRLQLVNAKIVFHLLDSDRADFSFSKMQPIFESLAKTKHVSFLIEHVADNNSSGLELEHFIDSFIYLPPLKNFDEIAPFTELVNLKSIELKGLFQAIIKTPRRWHLLRTDIHPQALNDLDFDSVIAASLLKINHLSFYQFFNTCGLAILQHIHSKFVITNVNFQNQLQQTKLKILDSFSNIEPKPNDLDLKLLDFLLTPEWRNFCNVESLPDSNAITLESYQRFDHGDGEWFPFLETYNPIEPGIDKLNQLTKQALNQQQILAIFIFQEPQENSIGINWKNLSLWLYHYENDLHEKIAIEEIASVYLKLQALNEGFNSTSFSDLENLYSLSPSQALLHSLARILNKKNHFDTTFLQKFLLYPSRLKADLLQFVADNSSIPAPILANAYQRGVQSKITDELKKIIYNT